ncbi:plasma-membrane proton-efflux P-type ATPase (plasmid) [Burkholderia thailandensis]|nr:plasma-membrane proton-efflux P-type ATPase [Burkholderia thailandensis]MBS2132174.1 plasma-membrane proton-efflux P-type ATPase [Burkholderia thailandensis]QRA15275.1 plasma-membrane proton-efflux P-type ATPase [Burkholderia thailandensis]
MADDPLTIEAVSSGSSTAAEAQDVQGLTSSDAARRLAQVGENALAEAHVSAFAKFLSYFWGPIPWMIEAAALLSALVAHWADFAIIMVMLLLNAGVGFWQEFKADTAIAALKQRLALQATVLRDGTWREMPARQLVPDDVVLIQLGNIVPADVRLVGGGYLSVDQSALTGESLPVDKKAGDVAYSGSIAKLGEMKARVTATGMNTYFGKTARLVEGAGAVSHFQRAVLRIGNFLIFCTLGLVALILVVALFRHDPLVETLLFALILTVAAIPVALPAVLSVTMAVGAERLAHLKAIVSRLVAIEELAGLDVLCADKTGTLTQNRLTLGKPVLGEARDEDELLLAAALASRREGADAIDAAIVAGLGDAKRLAAYTIVDFQPFDPVSKRAEATLEHEGARIQVAKGAPQVILAMAKLDAASAAQIGEQIDALAAKGYRTLGVARKDDEAAGWRFLGLLPLFDPPREDAAATIARARSMGVDVRMVTGDHQAIAREIAGTLGLGQQIVPANEAFGAGGEALDPAKIERAGGFAQVFPEHKYAIVKALQASDHIVGMTGDGVNDAPALKQADVGIAVSGATDAARAAADLVLTAPGLSVITTGIEEARRIFERMSSYATYRISETVRVLLFMTLSILVFNFYPVTAVMIVLLALLNDFPIMMIAYDNAPVAAQPVRWDMPVTLTIASVLGVLGVIASFVLFWIAERYLKLPRDAIQTVIFLKLLVAGHLTIYLTRNKGAIWQRPWPSWKLIAATETTQVIGTLAAVYGWFVTPIGWHYALLVWAYALVWFLVNSGCKILAYELIKLHGPRQSAHLARVGERFMSHVPHG